jgi:dTDP-glucose pyrophosphorylase
MNIIVTMAGAGSRFRDAGYAVPKYQIRAHGRTLFDWSMLSLSDYFPHAKQVLFIVRRQDDASSFLMSRAEAYGFPRPAVIELDHMTDGQATTALIGADRCEPNEPIMIYNIDTYIEPGQLRFDQIRGAGYLPCFRAPGTHWSFVAADKNGRARDVREKERISDNCSLGAYYFENAMLYQITYERLYGRGNNGVREKYIAPMYNLLISDGMDVYMSLVDETKVHVLGTPQELKTFLELPVANGK